ncbi:phosphodiester glycosidase family protein [Paenibacillus tengchongensis]|uniref:phosphodiester glycosidase family protein n=1 Tax=Paenibacillus tengchongensis TaxID=2608684 RepID=UPI001FE8914E|nr:phosphodiester glycosidase family protein [Paenibacillus tengchongensis]
MNDAPAAGARGAYGSGWFNAKYARGTLVWDGAADKLSVQVVSSGDDIAVADRSRYWAQGGISMNLQREDKWAAAAEAEHLPFAADKRLRSGLVYNADGQLWLLVTDTLCTAADFRSAVLQSVPGAGLEGIFLDGDGSSQMNADEAVLPGDSRPVVQMIALRSGE